jgi:DNA topoisomerase IB
VDDETRNRITELVIPPAWREVWISPWPNGHIQAVGTDAAGRRQYLYHQDWTAGRHRRKFARVSDFARQLPAARRAVQEHLALDGMPEERVLATAFSLLDRGHFRVGGEVYAQTNGSFGLATLRRDQVRREHGALVFDYTAKSGLRRVERIDEPRLSDSIAVLLRRRGGNPELLSYRRGRSWRAVGSAAINSYLKEVVGPDFSAKDFRTWHGTVLAAVALADLAASPPAKGWSAAARARAERAAVAQVSDVLGNTPAVCRGSYIDPRVIEAFERDQTVVAPVRRIRRAGAPGSGDELVSVAYTPTVERAVRTLLRDST